MSLLKILIAGDFCPIGRTEEYLKNENYKDLFNGYENLRNTVDYAIVNLECPITESPKKIKKSGPNIKSENLNSFTALKFAGFDLLTLANNHIQDFGEQGVINTIEYSKRKDFEIVGAGRNRDEASIPLIKEIKGVKIGIINIAENEFCAATDKTAGAYTFDLIDNFKLIQKTKKIVDKLILIFHGGREHYQLPTPNQRKNFRFFIDSGVDAIVAHHTHCFSGFEYYNDKPIVYSLGNFIFDYKKKYQKGLWTEGMSVVLSLEQNDFKIELIPHYQGREKDSTLKILKNEQKKEFLKKISQLNNILQNEEKFQNNWEAYVKSQQKYYLPNLYIKNIFLRAAFMKGFLPISWLNFKHHILLLNLFRCETHSEISKNILNK